MGLEWSGLQNVILFLRDLDPLISFSLNQELPPTFSLQSSCPSFTPLWMLVDCHARHVMPASYVKNP